MLKNRFANINITEAKKRETTIDTFKDVTIVKNGRTVGDDDPKTKWISLSRSNKLLYISFDKERLFFVIKESVLNNNDVLIKSFQKNEDNFSISFTFDGQWEDCDGESSHVRDSYEVIFSEKDYKKINKLLF